MDDLLAVVRRFLSARPSLVPGDSLRSLDPSTLSTSLVAEVGHGPSDFPIRGRHVSGRQVPRAEPDANPRSDEVIQRVADCIATEFGL